VAPVVSVALTRHGGVLAQRALSLLVSCPRGCKVLVTGTVTPRGRRGDVPLVAAARTLPRALAGHVRLLLGPRSLRRLRNALGRRRELVARVTVVAAGPTGRRTTTSRVFVVGR
jgi:hypothetical protein